MSHFLAAALLLAPTATLVHADAVGVAGTVCRVNRSGDRLILGADAGERIRVAVPVSARIAFEGRRYEAFDVRPGDRLEVFGNRDGSGRVTAVRADVSVPVVKGLVGALLGTKPPLVGRFAVREAKTEYFSLAVPGGDYVRVDARSAYGPNGRVRVSMLKSGDLLEVAGTWTRDGEISASSIRILTDDEPASCRRDAARGESKEQTDAREASERRFLDGYDDEAVDPR